jgi:signal transduction histidine kinase
VQEELKLAQQLGEMGSWCWEIDEDIISWSGQLYVLFGLDEIRQPPTFAEHGSLYTPQSFALLRNAVERAIQIGQSYHIEVEYIHRTGRRGWLDVRGAAERDVTGRVFRLHGTAQEITGMRVAREASGLTERISHLEACLAEEKGRNQQLEKAAADGSRLGAVGLIASGIAHDYNNVLTSLAVIMELLQSTSDESRSIHLAGQGKEAIDRASSLTRRLINVRRPQLAISTVAKLAEVLKSS